MIEPIPQKIIYIRNSLVGMESQMSKIDMKRLASFFSAAVYAITFFIDREADLPVVGNDYY